MVWSQPLNSLKLLRKITQILSQPTHSCLILLIDLDGLVCLCGDQSAATLVKGSHEDAGLTVQGARLDHGVDLLEVVASLPVPEVQAPIVT